MELRNVKIFVGRHFITGDIAFQDNFAAKAASASKVVVLRGTSSVPDQAFAGMTALEEAVIDEGVSYLSPSAFLGCTIRRAELPSHLLPVFPAAPLAEVPSARCTSASTVGLPRESMISRPVIFSISR